MMAFKSNAIENFPLNSSAVVCKSRSWDFISNVRSIKGARRQHVISDPNFSKDEHLSRDLNEVSPTPPIAISNAQFTTFSIIGDKV